MNFKEEILILMLFMAYLLRNPFSDVSVKEKIILSNIKTVKKILLKTTPVFLLGKSNG